MQCRAVVVFILFFLLSSCFMTRGLSEGDSRLLRPVAMAPSSVRLSALSVRITVSLSVSVCLSVSGSVSLSLPTSLYQFLTLSLPLPPVSSSLSSRLLALSLFILALP